MIVVGAVDGSIRLLDVETGKKLWQIDGTEGQGKQIHGIWISPKGKILTISRSSGFKFWDIEKRKQIQPLINISGIYATPIVLSVRWSSDEKTIAISDPASIRLFDVASGVESPKLPGHRVSPREILFVDNGKRIATNSRDGTMRIWDSKTGEAEHVYRDSFLPANLSSISGTTSIVLANRKSLEIFDYKTGGYRPVEGPEPFEDSSSNSKFISRLAWPTVSPDGKRLAAIEVSSDFVELPIPENLDARRREWYKNRPYGKRLSAERLVLWQMGSGKRIQEVETEGSRRQRRMIEFLDNDHLLGVVSEPLELRITHAINKPSHPRPVTYHREKVCVYPVDTLKPSRVLFEHVYEAVPGTRIRQFAISPDRTKVALAFGSAGATLISTTDGKVLHRWQPYGKNDFQYLSFSADGRRLLAGPGERGYFVWDTETGRPVSRSPISFPRGKKMEIGAAALSHDGKTVAVGLYDGTVVLCDVDTGRERTRLKGHKGVVAKVVFSPDDTMLVSASVDCSLLVWSLDLKDLRPRSGVFRELLDSL